MVNGRYLNAICESITAQRPDYEIEFVALGTRPEDSGHYLLSLTERKIDLLETLYYPGIYDGNVSFFQFFESDFCIAVPPGHRLSTMDSIQLDDLRNEIVLTPWTKMNATSSLYKAKSLLLSAGADIVEKDIYDMSVVASAKSKKYPILIADVWDDVFHEFKIFYLEWGLHLPYGIVYLPGENKNISDFIHAIKEYWKGERI